MKVIHITSILLILGFSVFSQNMTNKQNSDDDFYNATSKWFSAWTLISEEIFKIEKIQPVEFVFFDDKFVYSTSDITVKNGVQVIGSDLMNLSFKWKRAFHNDTIVLPNNTTVPIGLMAFAGEINDAMGKSFFVMPLPKFWEKGGVSSKELGLENLITGIFLHEFSHSQQMQNFGKEITEFEKQNDFSVNIDDNIVQNIFENDSGYVITYNKELNMFYQSIENEVLDQDKVKEGLLLLKQRHLSYFNEKYMSLSKVDKLFLTMEGLGQYSMYLMLIHPKGGNINKIIAIDGVRRNRGVWSQDEGFALFLILEKLSKPENWVKNMFGTKTENAIDLLNRHLHN